LNAIQEDQRHNRHPEQEVTASDPDRCTSGCTSEGKTEQADSVATIAAAMAKLSSADRERLAAILLSQKEKA
jgi:hypothetical protein